MGFKSSKLVILNFCAQTIPCKMQFLYKAPSIFIYTDILVPVSELVVVVILSEWWLFCLSGGWCRPLPTTVGTSLVSYDCIIKYMQLILIITIGMHTKIMYWFSCYIQLVTQTICNTAMILLQNKALARYIKLTYSLTATDVNIRIFKIVSPVMSGFSKLGHNFSNLM